MPPPLISNVNANYSKLNTDENSKVSDLSERLVADKNFQESVLFAYDFTYRLESTGSVKLFQKVANNSATVGEEYLLLKKLEFSNRVSLNDYLKSSVLSANKFRTNFLELKQLDNADEIILSAARKIVLEKRKSTKVFSRPLTCWEQFLLLYSACGLDCYNLPLEECYWPCVNYATAFYSLCILIEEM